MLTNISFKKMTTAMMLLVMCSMMFMTIGCSENSDNPIVNSNADEVVIVTTPEGEKVEILQSEIDKFIAQSESYQNMIKSMDPFVAQSPEGEFKFDENGFIANNSDVGNSGIFIDLKQGINIVNQKIDEQRRSGVAAKIWYQWYWWGFKECYSEYSAHVMIDFLSRGGWASYALYYAADYYHYHYGYFCLYRYWSAPMIYIGR